MFQEYDDPLPGEFYFPGFDIFNEKVEKGLALANGFDAGFLDLDVGDKLIAYLNDALELELFGKSPGGAVVFDGGLDLGGLDEEGRSHLGLQRPDIPRR